MRWNSNAPCNYTKTERWFAWYPVELQLDDVSWCESHFVWLEWVHRAKVYPYSFSKTNYWCYYSKPKEQVDFKPGE